MFGGEAEGESRRRRERVGGLHGQGGGDEPRRRSDSGEVGGESRGEQRREKKKERKKKHPERRRPRAQPRARPRRRASDATLPNGEGGASDLRREMGEEMERSPREGVARAVRSRLSSSSSTLPLLPRDERACSPARTMEGGVGRRQGTVGRGWGWRGPKGRETHLVDAGAERAP